MRAKSFFYVCAGLCFLALGYHLGARNAGAQAGQSFDAVGLNGSTGAGVIGRTIYLKAGAGQTIVMEAPGIAQVVAVSPRTTSVTIMLENGDIYEGQSYTDPSPDQWNYLGNLFGITPTEQTTFGSVKARYR